MEGKKILLVDDEKEFHEIFGAALTASGFEVAHAKNGQEAIAKTSTFKPDLVLMDINLHEEKRGVELAEEIMDMPENAGIKMAFLSNLADPFPAVSGENNEISKQLGMEGFIAKTDGPEKVVEKVRQILLEGAIAPETPPVPTP